ncbi:hypothetical protein M9H77_04068 [Catharanthus roseus]|uniref:Uncharacterized protein n=1 Tax=Catharanthus roseus TaxID=4058 RepID=A0ACC0CD73_CATRO|nr:hypothetical protein M9H77_04068 [Catharanthus roseus]
MAANHQIPEEPKVAVVMVPLPAQGHLNQLLHLSRIISSYDIPVHFVGTPTHNRQTKLRAHGWDPLTVSNLHFHEFPIPSFDVPPPNPNAPTKYPTQLLPLFNASIHLREPICALLKELSKTSKRVIVIHDVLMFWVIQDVPSIPNAESYCFHSTSAFTMYYFGRVFAGKPILVNGEPLKDLPPIDSLYPQELAQYIAQQENSRKCNYGNLYNNCRVIEGQYLNLLAEEKLTDTENHWAIGPFNPVTIPERKNPNKCLEWLDQKPQNSVIFVSFGTTTSLSDEEVKEIAVGLERSGQNFIWVLRDADRGDVFIGEARKAQIPEGFEERIEGRGIIVRDWAPQLEILGHPSTGGFMSHCGWNSCIESITTGVPIAGWPMHSDQPLNAILVKSVLRIGLIVREWEARNEIVKSETVEEAVKKLMASPEGAEMRQRAAELSNAVKNSVTEGGASFAELKIFIAHITR